MYPTVLLIIFLKNSTRNKKFNSKIHNVTYIYEYITLYIFLGSDLTIFRNSNGKCDIRRCYTTKYILNRPVYVRKVDI